MSLIGPQNLKITENKNGLGRRFSVVSIHIFITCTNKILRHFENYC